MCPVLDFTGELAARRRNICAPGFAGNRRQSTGNQLAPKLVYRARISTRVLHALDGVERNKIDFRWNSLQQ